MGNLTRIIAKKKKAIAAAAVFIALCMGAMLAAPAAGFAEEGPSYIGSDGCKMCHSERHEELSKTTMAWSFELLEIVGEEKNADCVGCHTTGYKKGGFVDIETTPQFKSITCEACHGPGEGYQEEMMSGDIGQASEKAIQNARESCVGCHRNFIHGKIEGSLD